jgi:hypothetical protein
VLQEGGTGANSLLGISSAAVAGGQGKVTACRAVEKMLLPFGGELIDFGHTGQTPPVLRYTERGAANRASKGRDQIGVKFKMQIGHG